MRTSGMRLLGVGVLLCASAAFGWWLSTRAAQPGDGRTEAKETEQRKKPTGGLLLDPPRVNLGELGLGQQRPFASFVKNRTQKDIEIGKLSPSCGCLGVGVKDQTIGAGAQTTLAGIFSAPKEEGPFLHRVTVFQSDGLLLGELEVVGKVVRQLQLSSPKVQLELDSREVKITITNRSNSAVTLATPESSLPSVRGVLDRSEIPPNESATLAIAYQGDGLTREDGTLRIATSHSSEKAVEVKVSCCAQNGFQVIPSSVNLGIIKPGGDEKERTFALRVVGAEHTVQSVDISCESGGITHLETSSVEGRVSLLSFKSNIDPQRFKVRGTITITLSFQKAGDVVGQKTQVRLRVPIEGIVLGD